MSTAGIYDEALTLFFDEAREMVQQIEDALLALELEQEAANPETINALFRAAHTIKGSAGIFSLDRVVRFTHQVESVLDRVRKNALNIDATLSELLFKSCDMMAALLAEAEHPLHQPEALARLDLDAATLAGQIAVYLVDQPVAGGPADLAADRTENLWHISLRFGKDAFRNGFDPLAVIRYLKTLGDIVALVTIDDAIPDWAMFDPESCHLGFELSLRSSASRADIDGAFEFVHDDCMVRVIAPGCRMPDFVALIQALPQERRLGDILIDCGAVTRQALDEALLRQESGAPAPLGEILIAQHQVAPEVVDAALSRQSKSRDARSDDARFVRVPADKLDELINLVGELVICGSSASLQALNLNDIDLIGTTQQMSGLVEEIRNGALSLRMVQIGETFARYRRVVRDVSGELGKQVQLEIEGAETELDKSVVEKIGDPLMHLVRNALDHGIESPQLRLAAGKPAGGTIRLSARHESGNILIRVSDDGRGLDGEKLLAKALQSGLVAPGQVLTEADKLNLIFAPGLSTAEAVTNLSGRGVGMDVVRKNIEALRGAIRLHSVIGEGTLIEIRLPLTLAIIDGFLVRIGGSSFVIPLNAVVECIDADESRLQLHHGAAGRIELRGGVLPFLDLRAVFSIAGTRSGKRSIVVVQSESGRSGLLVDQLLGEYQTVIKPLGKLFQNLRGISGSTVLGSGEVALILDVGAMVKLASVKKKEEVVVK
ncbi:chemotaxis protein CheA [Actimicrobium sp. CCC2.4]|uniref:chemotaxis protein CheA n=1 Tax=Actimicrobium sp. CCC2.4 TaxID=3048606 RepID=UPI002AC9B576|nr:chemotaxis protein CheA [Actimicrobium sp. CCC2.4]MEB0136608.1 chemotaxis protein CheA [Actimicrobium sp. CCC2.4]WPX31706.1 chemotaxis protein CheA [Actimicrobium sp. CCC2.4]